MGKHNRPPQSREDSSGGLSPSRVRVAKRLSAVRHAISGGKRGRPLPAAPASVVPREAAQAERRVLPTNIPEVGYKPDTPLSLHNQKISIPEHVGPRLPHGFNIVATFDLQGADGQPLGFSVLRQGEGTIAAGPVASTDGYPSHWAMPVKKLDVPTLTVVATADLDILRQMDDPKITPDEFADLRGQIRTSNTIVPGQQIRIGRDGAFGHDGSLGPEVSGEHLTIDFLPRQEGSGVQDGIVVVADHSTNGTNNVAVPSGIGR